MSHSAVCIILDFKGKRRYFSAPEAVLTTQSVAEVSSIINRVQLYKEQGYQAVGFLSYESGVAYEQSLAQRQSTVPLVWFAVFKSEQKDQFKKRNISSAGVSNISFGITKSHYIRRVNEIKKLIEQGKTYQVNYTFPITFDFNGDDYSLYETLRKGQKTNYSALIKTNSFSVVSLSPELFFTVKGRSIFVKPMKGTRLRGINSKHDQAQLRSLGCDQKNKAENLMIVDLLRNDLGRICEAGSVKTKRLFAIEKYKTLFQMTSIIKGRLRKNITLKDIFLNIFPSGSVTGAPKIETMKIISELENVPRGVYTGALGHVSAQETTFNVAIRTIWLKEGKGTLGVGGGITYSSNPESEYNEALLKGHFLAQLASPYELIETMLWEKGSIFLYKEHLQRLARSAAQLGYFMPAKDIEKVLFKKTSSLSSQKKYKLRLLLTQQGKCTVQVTELPEYKFFGKIAVSDIRQDSGDLFLLHKTTNRAIYNEENKKCQKLGIDDFIFLNEREEITEGTTTNIILQINGKKYTPPLTSGLLPGVYREYLKKRGVREKVLLKKDLEKAQAIFLCNSVRKEWPVTVVANKSL